MGVSYALAVTEPHSSGLGGGGATLTYNGNEGEEPKMSLTRRRAAQVL